MSSVAISNKMRAPQAFKRPESPERLAKKQFSQAKEYEKKMVSRVNYLAKEEQKFITKIQKTRDDAVRMQ